MMQKMNLFLLGVKLKMKELFTDEKGAVDIVAIVVLCGVAVLLAIVFKNELGKLISKLFGIIDETADGAMKNAPATD